MTDFNVPEGGAHEDAAQSQSIMTQLGGSGGDDFDVTSASAPNKTLPLQAIAIGLVLVIAAGALFLMRREGTRAGMRFDDIRIVVPPDTTIQKVANEEEILDALAQTGLPNQVPVENIHQNPFALGDGDPVDTGPVRPVGNPEEIAAERRRVQIQEAIGRIDVQSIMNGRVPIAKINGKLYKVGDVIDNLLRVERIDGRSAYFSVDDKVFEVQMGN